MAKIGSADTDEVIDVVEDPIENEDDLNTDDDSSSDDSGESVNPQDEEGTEGEVSEGGDDDQIVISMDGEDLTQEDEEQKHAPSWVKELRKSSREKDKKIRELEAKLNAGAAPAAKPLTLPAKPKLEDFDYDPDVYEEKLGEWFETKRRHDAQIEASKKAQDDAEKAWQDKLTSYGKAKADLKVRDYEDAEAYVQDRFNVTQQGIILQGLENPALVVYALGKNHKKATELAGITDPVRFAVAVGKLETQLKVTTRKSPPPPPRTVSGTGRVSGAVDSTLDRLRTEAEKTGDYTKVLKYKQQKKKPG
jgi:hypothetical protein